jgi:uncharacterized membrane protein YdjX (TVP38/TMEM64 family)
MHPSPVVRHILLVFLILAITSAGVLLFGTERGRKLRDKEHMEALGRHTHEWVHRHGVLAPLLLIASMCVLSILAMPMWWLEVLAGYGFGMIMGVVWVQISVTIAGVLASATSRFLLYDWFHTRVESHAARLRALDEKMGNNGLLVVCAVRLAHLLPAGISNYAFGVSTIRLRHVAIGTLIGSLPAVVTYVSIGAIPHQLTHDWRYMTAIVALNLALLVPLALLYFKPQWFRRRPKTTV